MPDRPKLGPGSGVIPGLTFFTEYQSVMKGLWDAANLPLTNVGGTADDVEADLDWPLDAGLIDGMKFTLTWAASNTGPMTLRLNWSGGNTPQVDVLTLAGDAMNPGTVEAGTRSMVEYISGAFRVLGGGGEGGAMAYYEALTTSGDWTKPLGFLDDAMVIIELWGGGGGGARNAGSGVAGGGGGGAYFRRHFRYGDLPSTIPFVIGAGGTGRTGSTGDGSAGGGTSFGALGSANGGAQGVTTADAAQGGSSPVTDWSGGKGATSGSAAAHGVYGGGGGGGRASTITYSAGGSVFDGGIGGVGSGSGPAGDGQTPGGGGGGANSNNDGGFGARGEIRIWIVG